MAEKQCNLVKNGGGMGIISLDYANAEPILGATGSFVNVDGTGLTYTATKPGAIILSLRLGRASTLKGQINNAQVFDIYSAETTTATSGEMPIYTTPTLFVNEGDTFLIKRTWGNYAWIAEAYFYPYKT